MNTAMIMTRTISAYCPDDRFLNKIVLFYPVSVHITFSSRQQILFLLGFSRKRLITSIKVCKYLIDIP